MSHNKTGSQFPAKENYFIVTYVGMFYCMLNLVEFLCENILFGLPQALFLYSS